MNGYTPTIGIEVHAEVKTESKMFCGCKNDPFASEPNQNVCPVCMAHPGTLPTVNKEAVRQLLRIGTAVGGTLSAYTEFDRKNYFYPDIPKGYQISQYQFPFVSGGSIKDVELTRIHLEEDTAKSLHDQGSGSIVDFNRAGVPLMELVTEPVIHDAKTAADFCRELQLLLRTVGISDANMEKGEMRVEANISVSKSETLGTKVEVKNLNSFKVMEQAILYEIKRQVKILEEGEEVTQETRGWNESNGSTFSQRVKETADDYRYFPDPDIPKMDISRVDEFSKSRLTESLPILPQNKRINYLDLGLPENQIELLIQNQQISDFADETFDLVKNDRKLAKLASNYITSDIFALVEGEDVAWGDASADMFAKLLIMLGDGEVNSRVAKDHLQEVVFSHSDPKTLAEERGLLQQNDTEELTALIKEIIAEHAEVADEYRSGKEAALKFLVGQGMKKSKGAANPTTLERLLKEALA